MPITVSSGRHRGVRLFSRFKVAQETDERLVLGSKRLVALLAAAFAGVFGAVFGGAALHFYPTNRDAPQVLIVGALGMLLLLLALFFLYHGLRRPDRIIFDRLGRQVRIETARKSKRRILGFDELAEVDLETKHRRMGADMVRVHAVCLRTRSGEEVEVDAASDLEQMIRLAAQLRRVTGLPPAGREGA